MQGKHPPYWLGGNRTGGVNHWHRSPCRRGVAAPVGALPRKPSERWTGSLQPCAVEGLSLFSRRVAAVGSVSPPRWPRAGLSGHSSFWQIENRQPGIVTRSSAEPGLSLALTSVVLSTPFPRNALFSLRNRYLCLEKGQEQMALEGS